MPSITDTAKPLCAGEAINIGGRTYHIGRELGKGNFGVVFEAFANGDFSPVALKVSLVKDAATLSAQARRFEEAKLLSEIQLLKRLTDELSRLDPDALDHVSAYVCHTILPSQVVFVMSKAKGLSLDEWLYGLDTDDTKHIPPRDWLEGRLPCGPGSHTDSTGLVSACAFASTLLLQVAPAFAVLQGIGFHRDVSAHNFLIDDSAMGQGGCPHFTVIDLGLSVEASSWNLNWAHLDVSGDPRYWTPAHCLKVVIDGNEMERQSPILARLYRERIDHYALGVLVLEVVFARWVGPKDEARASGPLKAIVDVRASWRHYWFLAWELFQILHAHGGCEQTRHRLIVGTGLHLAFIEALRTLCAALRAASALMANAPCGGPEVAVLLLTAADLMDPASTLSWGRLPHLLGGGAAVTLEYLRGCHSGSEAPIAMVNQS